MRDRPVFNFLPESRSEFDEGGTRSSETDSQVPVERKFEPTRDGWRAYQAWCKQIREDWEPKS